MTATRAVRLHDGTCNNVEPACNKTSERGGMGSKIEQIVEVFDSDNGCFVTLLQPRSINDIALSMHCQSVALGLPTLSPFHLIPSRLSSFLSTFKIIPELLMIIC